MIVQSSELTSIIRVVFLRSKTWSLCTIFADYYYIVYQNYQLSHRRFFIIPKRVLKVVIRKNRTGARVHFHARPVQAGSEALLTYQVLSLLYLRQPVQPEE